MSSARTERRAGKWDEVVLAACGISGDNADKILQAIAPIDPYLAQKCIEAGAVPSIESHLAIIFGLDRQVGKFESTIASCEAAMEEYGCYPPNRGYDEAQAAAAWSHEAINQTEAAIERQGDSLIADVRAQRIPDQLTPSIIRALKIIDTGPAQSSCSRLQTRVHLAGIEGIHAAVSPHDGLLQFHLTELSRYGSADLHFHFDCSRRWWYSTSGHSLFYAPTVVAIGTRPNPYEGVKERV